MADDPPNLPAPLPKPSAAAIELSKTVRSWCIVGGMLSVGFAGVVLWRGQDGAATVAFVALAALFFLLAVAGVVPRRIKSGEHEMELTRDQAQQAAIEQTDAAVDTMSRPEIEAYIADTLRSARDGDPSGVKSAAATRAQEAIDFETIVLSMLASFSDLHSLSVAGLADSGYDVAFRFNGTLFKAEIVLSTSLIKLRRIVSRAEDDSVRLIILKDVPPFAEQLLEEILVRSSSNKRILLSEAARDTLRYVVGRAVGETLEPPTYIGRHYIYLPDSAAS